MKNNNKQTLRFQFFLKVAEVFVSELTEVTFGCLAHAQKTEIMQIYSRKCSARAQKTRSRGSFCDMDSQIDRNQGAICENVSCVTESMAESIDRAPAKPSLTKRRCFQTFKKVHYEKWSFTTVYEKGDTCMNSEVGNSVVK